MENISEDQLLECREAFLLFDKDSDGSITVPDLRNAFQTIGIEPTDADLNDIITQIDVDGNGAIEFNEFAAMKIKKTQRSDNEEEIRQAWRIFDKKGAGFFTREELHKLIVRHLGERLPSDEIQEMIIMADSNNENRITFEKFKTSMSHKK